MENTPVSPAVSATDSTPVTRTLRRAIDALGTAEQLAQVMGVTAAMVAQWLSGERPVPQGVYLKALDLVAHPVSPRYWT